MEMFVKLLMKFDTWLESWEVAYRNRNMEPNPNVTQTPPFISIASPQTPLARFCHCIENYEGGPDDPNHVNNNPGDFRYYYGGYLPKYGVVKESTGGFAVFETYQLGWEYMLASVTEMVEHHPGWNFLDFFAVYAPAKDNNNPVHYANTVAAEMEVDVTSNLKTVLQL